MHVRSSHQIDLTSSKSVGIMCLIAQVVSNSFALIFLKKSMQHYEHSTYFTAQAMTGAAPIMLAINLFTGDLQHLAQNYHRVSTSGWLAVLYCGVVVIGLGQVMHNWAVKFLPASTTSLYYMLQPVFGVSLAAIFLGKLMVWREVFGFALILTGLFINVHAQQAEAKALREEQERIAAVAKELAETSEWDEGDQLLQEGEVQHQHR